MKNIIFDLGGVILNIDYLRTSKAFKELGHANFDDLYTQASQTPLFNLFETGKISEVNFFGLVFEGDGGDFTALALGVKARATDAAGFGALGTGVDGADLELDVDHAVERFEDGGRDLLARLLHEQVVTAVPQLQAGVGVFEAPLAEAVGGLVGVRRLHDDEVDGARALGLENLKRQWGVHAAGVIMSSEPLIEPLTSTTMTRLTGSRLKVLALMSLANPSWAR